MGNSQKIPRREKIEAEEEEFACEICTETKSKNKKFKNKNLCKHPFCVDCIAKYAQVSIEDDKTAKIECPELNCKQLLDPLSCRSIIEPNLFAQWCDLLFENYLLGFERSFCPNKNCTAIVVNECGGRRRSHGKVKKTQCPTCKQLFCFQCKVEWHEGYSCEENDKARENDILFGQLVQKMSWAKCPGCGNCVELKYGCGNVKCRCKTRFCYYCGEKFPCFCKKGTTGSA